MCTQEPPAAHGLARGELWLLFGPTREREVGIFRLLHGYTEQCLTPAAASVHTAHRDGWFFPASSALLVGTAIARSSCLPPDLTLPTWGKRSSGKAWEGVQWAGSGQAVLPHTGDGEGAQWSPLSALLSFAPTFLLTLHGFHWIA